MQSLCNGAALAALVCSWGSMGRECWAGRQLWKTEVCHIQICTHQQWVKAAPKIRVIKCCSLRMEEMVVCASRGDCKAGKAGMGCLPSCCPWGSDSTAKSHVQVSAGKGKKNSGKKRKWFCFTLFFCCPAVFLVRREGKHA